MDVLGNNIANVNTTGFKKGRVTFQDMLYQSLSSAVRPSIDVGGVNPKQLGLGMLISTVDTIHTQGSLQTTGVSTDVAIQGEGFFVLRSGQKQYFTRAGAFDIDGEDGIALFSGGTDGNDGPTDAAGGIAFGDTLARAKSKSLDAAAYLTNNDAYHFLEGVDDLVKTGPTGTNVMDLRLILVS